MRKHVNCDLPYCVKMVVSYTCKKLNASFNVKYKILFGDENYFDRMFLSCHVRALE